MSRRWIHRPDIISYVVDSYAGVDNAEGSNKKRRVFIWEDGDELKMGNTEAFAAHLEKKFSLLRADPSYLHEMLRDMGESVQQHKQHAPRIRTNTGFKQPEPDEWVIGKVDPEVPKPE